MALDGNPSGRELPQYKCHKIVRAAKIISISHPSESLHGTLELEGFGPIKLVSGWMEKHQPHVGGYFVAYEAGYTSFSPADAFERGYTRIEKMGQS